MYQINESFVRSQRFSIHTQMYVIKFNKLLYIVFNPFEILIFWNGKTRNKLQFRISILTFTELRKSWGRGNRHPAGRGRKFDDGRRM